MKKLITMTEYVVWINYRIKQDQKFHEIFYNRVTAYTKLLQTPLELGMFIPCKDGEPMEKPNPYMMPEDKRCEVEIWEDCREWDKALDKVLFEGCELQEVYKGAYNLYNGKIYIGTFDKNFKMNNRLSGKTIEHLINYGIELIPTESLEKKKEKEL